ncbi:MFS general substrate transporter [Sarocladium strictum]
MRLTPKKDSMSPELAALNLILLVPLVSFATIGFDGAIMNCLQASPQGRDSFNTPSPSLLGLVNALYPIGKILAIFLTNMAIMWIGLVMLMLGAVLQAASQDVTMFLVSRFALGASTAFIAIPSPILVAELAYSNHRRKLIALYNTLYFFNAVLAAWSAYGTFKLKGSKSWRIPSALQGAFPVLQFMFIHFLPESPRWLVAHEKHEEARRRTSGSRHLYITGDAALPLVSFEMAEIIETIRIELSAASSSPYVDFLKTPANRKRTSFAMCVGYLDQWPLQLFNWFDAVFGGALMVGLVGRRTLFLVPAGGMCLSYVAWTALTGVFVDTLSHTVGNVVVVSLFVYFFFVHFFFYDIAFTPLMPAYPIEIFPCTLRGRGVTVAHCSTYICLILGQFVSPIAMTAIGWRYDIVFCCLLAILFAIVWFYYPETRGRTLEESAEIFDGKPVQVSEAMVAFTGRSDAKMFSEHDEAARS